ncbi:hypothetical protein Syun_018402 [Stephania yunnanensis]|uniref:Uncharacterized protein n=1 Tax=Stephania yunnanensis TaxID=152371 RepID=A0AAP0ISU7_9MAGN
MPRSISLPSRTGPSASPCSTRSPEASPSSSNNSAPIFATPSTKAGPFSFRLDLLRRMKCLGSSKLGNEKHRTISCLICMFVGSL